MTDTVQIDPKFDLNNSTKKWSIKNYLVGKALGAFKECDIGSIEITLPDGTRFEHAGSTEGPKAGLHFKTARGINKYIFEGEVGFAKAFIDGDVDIPDPLALFKWYLANDAVLSRSTGLDAVAEYRLRSRPKTWSATVPRSFAFKQSKGFKAQHILSL